MDRQFREVFDSIKADERLLRQTKAYIRRKTFDYGRQTAQYQSRRRRAVACCLCLILMLGGTGLWFIPTASIGLDINPSLELKVNALDRVISLRGNNPDGVQVADHLDVSAMPYDEAMQRILLSQELTSYLENGSMISISLVGGVSDAHALQMLSNVVCRAYAVAEDENVFYCQTDRQTLEKARAAGLCIPRYLAWQHLLESDKTVTPEQVARMDQEEIRALAQLAVLDNPCGE